MTSTTIQLDVPTPASGQRPYTTEVPAVDLIKVYPAGQTSGPEAVILDLLRNRKVRPVDGGGHLAERTAAFALTRDEAFGVIRAIQRAMGINPDRLRDALLAVEENDDPDAPPRDERTPDDTFAAFDELYEAVAEVTGLGTAAERAGTSLKGER